MNAWSWVTPNRRTPDTFDERWPPNATRRRIRIWDEARPPEDHTILPGQVYVERWTNGHYSDPTVAHGALLDTDNSGNPLRTCERRIVNNPDVRERAIRAEAWDEGAQAVRDSHTHDQLEAPNPYREAI